MTVSAVIPAYNEEETIGKTVAALRGIDLIAEVIVVDDGSNDLTAAVAAAAGAKVIKLPRNCGKAAALAAGAAGAKGDILCFADADLGFTAAEFCRLLPPVLSGHADMTVALFPKALKSGGFGLVKALAGWGIKRLTGCRVCSPLSGQRVLRKFVWERAAPYLTGFGAEAGMTIVCLREGFSFLEIPVEMQHRETGRDLAGFCHRGMQFFDLLKTLMALWLRGKARAT
ncbi:MAG: glycosyltransferase [Bacillota bacterium]|jgi:glycosyltransferase involved in cell wall biosynthesis|nr:glycosyltransferase [Bacillota bacterium]HHU30698.1 glycosyltransferase [Bacillota bacterium]